MKLNWNFQRGGGRGGVLIKKIPSMGEVHVWIFSIICHMLFWSGNLHAGYTTVFEPNIYLIHQEYTVQTRVILKNDNIWSSSAQSNMASRFRDM